MLNTISSCEKERETHKVRRMKMERKKKTEQQHFCLPSLSVGKEERQNHKMTANLARELEQEEKPTQELKGKEQNKSYQTQKTKRKMRLGLSIFLLLSFQVAAGSFLVCLLPLCQ